MGWAYFLRKELTKSLALIPSKPGLYKRGLLPCAYFHLLYNILTESKTFTSVCQGSTDKPYTIKSCYMHVEKGPERKESWITGCAVLTEDRVIVADYNNNRIKVINVEEELILSRIVLSTSPKDLALVSSDFVAVTLPALDTVQFLSMEGHLPVLDISTRSFKVDGYCSGIECNDDRLFVSFTSPPKVEVFTLEGEVIQSIATDQYGLPLFKSPQYLLLHHGMIFVSDSDEESVVKMSSSGHVISTYQNEALKNPQGLAVTDDGYILICGQDTHNIHLITADCRKVSIILDKTDGIWWPHVTGFCCHSNTVYVSSTSGEPEFDNYLRMYSFTDMNPLSLRLMNSL